MKVLTVVGTRPEVIRLSRVASLLDAHTDHVFVHTGQNYDYELNQVFFDDLGLRAPDHYLNVDVSSLGRVLADVIVRSEEVLLSERPDAVLVLGDTNSCLSAVMARRLGIPVFHMEAGNRCFDLNVPEETNRRIVDHVSDINLVYTEHARRNLLAEGIEARRIFLTGSPLRQVIDHNRAKIEAASPFSRIDVKPREYYLVSMHREENVDAPDRLEMLVSAMDLLSVSSGYPVVVSTHPRTKRRLEGLGSPSGADVRWLPPFGFHDYCALQSSARCVLSDSGSVSEEASLLGVPAITMRDAIERPEAMDSGCIGLTGVEPGAVLDGVRIAESLWASGHRPPPPHEYRIADTAERVLRLIVGVAPLVHGWSGRRPLVF